MCSSSISTSLALEMRNAVAKAACGYVILVELTKALIDLMLSLVLLSEQSELLLHHLHRDLSFKDLPLLSALIAYLHLLQLRPPDHKISIAFISSLKLRELLILFLGHLKLEHASLANKKACRSQAQSTKQ